MYIIVGKSGSGKTTLLNKMSQNGYQKVVTCTTRKPRDGETDGVDYHFLSMKEFERLIGEGAFIEFVSYNGNYRTGA